MTPGSGAVLAREMELFQESQNQIHCRADRLFAKLMVAQWLAGIAAALWISPRTWMGAASQTHWHVWAAIFLGGAITELPVFLAWKQPGRVLTRHVIAVAQMLTSAQLIHLTGGRIETHFHIFGSLAFLAFYRDWRVLLTATIVVATDHMARGIFWPQSVFGVLSANSWRWMEHAGWVLFEDTFLFISIRQNLRDMLEVATRRAGLEAQSESMAEKSRFVESANQKLSQEVIERTRAEQALQLKIQERKDDAEAALRDSDEKFRQLADNITDAFWIRSPDMREVHYISPAFERIWGRSAESLYANPQQWTDAILPQDRERVLALFATLTRDALSLEIEYRIARPDGEIRWIHVRGFQVRNAADELIRLTGIVMDITERKRADEKLKDAHKQLLETSRQAGMAEVATSVLHNVGNVLNSVNVSATLVADGLKKSKAADLGRVVALLDKHADNLGAYLTQDTQGRHLPAYLRQLNERLAKEQQSIFTEVESLRQNIEHIKDIVAMQQSYAKVSGVTEVLKVADLVEDSLRMNAAALERHKVEVVREYHEVPQISLERHKALQIMVNLIRNAKYACDEGGQAEKCLTVRVANGDGCIHISVTDNGVGIPPENLTRIFNHGFTTRKEGHGFGLHSGALAAMEMGGALLVHSDGHGKGATFTLDLPLNDADRSSASAPANPLA
jgi:PAS domain S-box-containing protein